MKQQVPSAAEPPKGATPAQTEALKFSQNSQNRNGEGAPPSSNKPRNTANMYQPAATSNPNNLNKGNIASVADIRRVKMTISKVDPLSALKLGFLISVAIGIMIIVAMAILWFVLDSMHVFSQISIILDDLGNETMTKFMEYLKFGRWMSFAVIIAIIDTVLFTALSAVVAVVYNLITALVGGLRLTVTDE